MGRDNYLAMRRSQLRGEGDKRHYNDIRKDLRAEWCGLNDEHKRMFLADAAKNDWLPAGCLTKGANRGEMSSASKEQVWKSLGCLFTFNGSWLTDNEEWKELCSTHLEFPKTLATMAAERKDVQDLFCSFCDQVDLFANWAGWMHWSSCLEISLEAESPGRVHLHCYAHWRDGSDQAGVKAQRLVINGVRPDFRYTV